MSDTPKVTPSEDGKETTPKVDETKFVSKEKYEELAGSKQELETKLDEAKLSMLDPEYIAYLETKKVKSDKPTKTSTVIEEDIDNLSTKQLLALSIDKAKEAILTDVMPKYEEALRKRDATIKDILAVLELQQVEKKYKDFDSFRTDIKKILENSQTPLTIDQAYKSAKLDRLVAEGKLDEETKEEITKVITTPKESEKPDGSVPADTITKATFKTKDDASNDAWDKVVGAGKDTL